MTQLRYYQRDAVDSVYQFCQENAGRNPCVVLPTGAGKTHVIVQICRDVMAWGGRVLVLAHVKELLEQTADELRSVDGLDVGVYSASLKQRCIDNDVIVAGVQSVYNRGLELSGSRPFNIVIVDEAHRIPVEGEGMYVTLLKDLHNTNPKVRVIGLTATPYRTGDGMVCSDDHFLNEVCYEVGVKELITGGFLCPLTSKRSVNEVDMTGVSASRGDYVQADMESRFNDDDNVNSAVDEIKKLTAGRNQVLIFCCGVSHASSVLQRLRSKGESCRMLTGSTPAAERIVTIRDYKVGAFKHLINVNVLTEGFNATSIDCVVLLRATISPGLYYQMVGRALRTDASKENALVLDFGGNIQRHGTIDNLKVKPKKVGGNDGDAPVKACPECQSMIHAGLLTCPDCGFEFPPLPPNHEATASDIGPLDAEVVQSLEVTSVEYTVHEKRGGDANTPKTMRVTYYDGIQIVGDEWICVEHSGFAFEKAWSWWFRRSLNAMPRTAKEAVSMARRGALAEPTKIEIKTVSGDKFPRIVGYKLGEKRSVAEREPGDDEDDDVFFDTYGITVDECPF